MSIREPAHGPSPDDGPPREACSGRQEAATTPLPLRLQVEPAFTWSVSLVASAACGLLARQRVRPALTMARWEGNVDIAARVADKLVDNALVHGEPFGDGTVTLRLIIDATTRELLIEVDDALPDFPGFAAVANQSSTLRGTPRGPWWVAHYQGRLSWDVIKTEDGRLSGKTVQAILPVT
ncbi:hypothetical protein ACIPSE_47000 [Streptomyces sp. NPDC090106]|uniref:hypothetical protein n=1 Tax=Streptomyces sp. NPDC090106 TaxID=3365946 RepID=UPI00380CA05F